MHPQGIFSAAFKVPDVYGIFKFVVNHYRIGYSYIDISEQVSVRPFKHNQFERFIVAAYPYYSSVFSMMAGFFVFGVLFLHAK
jgi:oligosaccharyltransferase complex subunit beta